MIGTSTRQKAAGRVHSIRSVLPRTLVCSAEIVTGGLDSATSTQSYQQTAGFDSGKGRCAREGVVDRLRLGGKAGQLRAQQPCPAGGVRHAGVGLEAARLGRRPCLSEVLVEAGAGRLLLGRVLGARRCLPARACIGFSAVRAQ